MKKLIALLVLFVVPLTLPAADLTITAANVAYVSGPYDGKYVAGEAVTAGQLVYLKNDNKYYLSSSNTAGRQTVSGVALVTAAKDTPLIVALPGCVYTVGATVSAGLPLYSSKNNGGIAPAADLTTGWNTNLAIVGRSATTAVVAAYNSGSTN